VKSRVARGIIVLAVVAAAGACAVMCPRRKADTANVTAASRPATTQASPATQADGALLTVTVKDLRNHKGTLVFGVFSQAAGFPNVQSKSVYWEVKDASANTVTFTTRLPPGRYAASVLHDENRSGDMDRGIGGLPLEGYGVTNNPKPHFRKATFDEATFTLPPQGAAMTISLQYF
jgi:uncharacterized protein (DUF2141 family)